MGTLSKKSYDLEYGFRINTEIYEENGKEYFLIEVRRHGAIQFFDEVAIKKDGEENGTK